MAGTTTRTLLELALARAEARPDAVGYRFLDARGEAAAALTYGGLAAAAGRVAAALAGGVARGDAVLLVFPPGLDYVAGLFGAWAAGAVPVPCYPPAPGRSVAPAARMAAVAGARVGLTAPGFGAMLAAALPELAWVEVAAAGEGGGGGVAPAPAGDVALLQFTSGSTANPRAVRVTHDNLLANLAVIARRFGHDEGARGVIWLPPYHDMGLVGGILEPLHSAFPVWLMSPLDFLRRPASWLEAVSRYRATTSGGPDFAYALAASRTSEAARAALDLSSWRVAFTGAERVRAATLARFSATFAGSGFDAAAFHPCYGLAEATLYATGRQGARTHPDVPGLVSCGAVAEGHALRVVDPETGEELGADEVGAIELRGPSVAAGYLGDDPEGRFARTGGVGERWLSSGDLGRLRDGELYVVGRRAATLKVRGRAIQAEDVEDLAARTVGALRAGRIAAFGADDGARERLVVVAEVRAGEAVEVAEVAAALDEALARELGVGLDELALLAPGALPLTSSGKLRRGVCQNAHRAGTLAPVARWTAGSSG